MRRGRGQPHSIGPTTGDFAFTVGEVGAMGGLSREVRGLDLLSKMIPPQLCGKQALRKQGQKPGDPREASVVIQ